MASLKISDRDVKLLLQKYKEIDLLGKISAVLDWDLNVNLPENAAFGRAAQSAYITELTVDKWLEKNFQELLQRCITKKSKLNIHEKAVVRNLEHSAKVYLKVPKEILVEKSKVTSLAFMAWQQAKAKNDFEKFAPHLEKLVKLDQTIAKHIGYKDNPYDALLDLYEPGLTAKQCKQIFGLLTKELTKTLKVIQKSKAYKNAEKLNLSELEFPIADQRQLSLFVLRKMGYDLKSGRMDISSHPFTTTLGKHDVRITNRYKLDNFVESIMVAMHEGGHALYEQGVAEEFEETPLDGGVSLGIHESQSRFWENQIGRSESFLKFLTPVLQAFYPDQLSDFDLKTLALHFNKVAPSLIRVEADELTYNLHIAIRFELEEALINGQIKVKDLPELWKGKMKKYLGVIPETDSEGVLQDVHWSYGSFGYFPTYTLGNLYAAQITAKLKKDLNIEKLSEKGELGTILSWLRSNVHQYGSLYWPDELIKKVTGKNLDPKYFLDYIEAKYSQIYK